MNDRDLKLQRLHDAELQAEEAARLKDGLSDEERGKLAGLEHLGGLLRGALSTEAEGVDLWPGIEARLSERPGERGRRVYARATALVTALAMAAAFIVWLLPHPRPSNHCDLESLEVAGAVATVLEIPDDDGAGEGTTVIWVDHDESDEWESL